MMYDKYLKRFAPYMKEWFSAHYSKAEAEKRWEKTAMLYNKWVREEGVLGGRKNIMAHNLIMAYAFFAFYESTDKTLPKEDLDGFTDIAMGKKLKFISHFDMNTLEKKKWLMHFAYRYFGNYAKKADKHRFKDWGNTWKIRLNPEKHDKGISFVFDTCPINDFARKYGYIDFLPAICKIDQLTCRTMHAALIRHKTLACGDGECQYWIIGDKNPEALADSGSK